MVPLIAHLPGRQEKHPCWLETSFYSPMPICHGSQVLQQSKVVTPYLKPTVGSAVGQTNAPDHLWPQKPASIAESENISSLRAVCCLTVWIEHWTVSLCYLWFTSIINVCLTMLARLDFAISGDLLSAFICLHCLHIMACWRCVICFVFFVALTSKSLFSHINTAHSHSPDFRVMYSTPSTTVSDAHMLCIL